MDEQNDRGARYATFDALLNRLVMDAEGDVAKALGMVDDYVATMVAGGADYKRKWADKLRSALHKLEADISRS